MLSTTNVEKKGDLSSVFVHLGALPPTLESRFVDLKKSIASKDPAVLEDAYRRVLVQLENETQEIKHLGPACIPQIEFADIQKNNGCIPPDRIAEIKKRGVVVIRGLISPEEAAAYKDQLYRCIERHRDTLVGFPENDPQAWELYYTRAQVSARSHPNWTMASVAMNQLWHSTPEAKLDLTRTVAYCDRLRVRKPGDTSFALSAHVDGGSVERWEDPEYRQCYRQIFAGKWEQHDPYDVTHRIEANMDMYDSPGGCSAFRIFQGWLSLSHVEPNGGTLRVCPLTQEPMAYILMKPLLKENLDKSDLLGSWPGRCSDITKENHPHIIDAMVSIPTVAPGDAVFWHCDQVHAVEPKNESDRDSTVLYIPSVPVCERNSRYLQRQRACFEKGLTPPDFPANHCEQYFDETDRATVSTLTDNERRSLGLAPLEISDASLLTPGQSHAIETHHRILGLSPL